MKSFFRSTLVTACVIAALAVPAAGASFILNPSFETDYNETWPHYGPLTDWVFQGGTGTNRGGGPFHNVGTPIPDGEQVALLQGSGFLSQVVTGLTEGQTYWIQFFYDMRACCGANALEISVQWEGEELARITGLEPVTNGSPYRFLNVPFTPAADTGMLTITTSATGDATALFDGVTIVPGAANRVVVANPSFEASGTPPDPGYLTAGAGWSGGGSGGVGVNASGGTFANNGQIPDQDHVVFIQGASYIEQTLRGLVTGESYSVTFRYNASTGSTPTLRVNIDDVTRFEQAVTPVGANASYREGSTTFVAAGNTAVLRFDQLADGNHTVLLDDIRVTGVVVEPIPNLKVGPARLELGPGQQGLASFTVSGRRLESGAATVQIRIPNETVARLVDADANGVVTLSFPQGAVDATLTTPVEGVGRGSVNLEIVDNGGHEGVDGTLIINGVTSLVVNPSFEASGTGPGVGYGPVLSWTGGSGINNASQPFADNGLIPDREQLAFIQGTSALSQTINGLTPNQRYAIQVFYNVRNCCDGGTMQMTVRLDGTDLETIADIAPVGVGAPYHFLNIPFIPIAASATLEIATTAAGDATLLLDAISIVPQAADEIVVMNPSFEASGVPTGVGYQNAMAGWTWTGGHGVNIDTVGPFADNGVAGTQDRVAFIQGPASLSQIVPGLTAGNSYTLEYLVNARNGDTPGGTPYQVLIDGLEALNTVQEPVGVGNPYSLVTLPFTASAETVEIRIEGLATGTIEDDHSLLIDDVRIRPAGTPNGLTVPLTITLVAGNSVNLSWPATAPAGLVLQYSTNLRSGTWSPVTTVPFIDGGSYNVLEPIDVPVKLYRLARP